MVPFAWHLRGGPEHPVFVIATDGAALRSEPTPGATVVGRLPTGSEAGRIDQLPDWVRVEGADGTRGWVERAEVAPLSFPSS
jgi:hypothetical protein